MRPLAAAFYGVLAIAGLWHAGRAAGPLLARFEAPAPTHAIAASSWWDGDGWRELPARRNERSSGRRWPLDLQVAGPLDRLRATLAARGWREQRQADWLDVLGLLDDDRAPAAQAVLPATLGAEAEVLLLRHAGTVPGEEQVLHVWRAPAVLDDGSPLWLGSAQTMRHQHVLDVVGLWQPVPDGGAADAAVREALAGFPAHAVEHDGIGLLRVDARAAAAPAASMPPATRR
jgi:hypothetical protein